MLVHEKNIHERGYVLVTSLVLLSILTIVGVVSAYKSIVEIKVSKLSGDSARSLNVATAGLNQLFWYWNQSAGTTGEKGYDELLAISDDIATGAKGTSVLAPTTPVTTPAGMTSPLVRDVFGETLSALDVKAVALDGAVADLDGYIFAGNNIRVYQYNYTGSVVTGLSVVNNNTWGLGVAPQVAVWVTSYKPSANQYPYGNGNVTTALCVKCNIVAYAVGRSGETRHLIRETMGVISNEATLRGVAALTNAPPYGTFSEQCNAISTGDMGGNATKKGKKKTVVANAWPYADDVKFELDNTVIDATQAPYVRDVTDPYSNPSGTAMKSNTVMGLGSKGFRKGVGSATGASFSHVPHIVYSGHGVNDTYTQVEAALANKPNDNTDPYSNLPGAAAVVDGYSWVMPHHLVNHSVLGTKDEIKYFTEGQPQLFSLNAYRWAAEQLTCQDPATSGASGNGRYCDKAEALRAVVSAMWEDPYATLGLPNPVPATAPISGRLTVAEFEYNINYGIPMFGIIRVMMPTTKSGTTADCKLNGTTTTIDLYNISGSVATMTTDDGAGGTSEYTVDATGVDSDGTLDSTARVLVYGSLFFDYFTDDGTGAAASNNVFDPASGERLLIPLESMDSYMKIEFPILINPSMPRGSMLAFPTIAPQVAGIGSTVDLYADARINIDPLLGNRALMSPYDGYFPLTEGLLKQTMSGGGADANADYVSGLAGTMRLMGNGTGGTPAGLSSYTNTIATNTLAGTHSIPAAAGTAFTGENAALKYYYDLSYAGAKQDDKFSWPIADFPASLTGGFYIGVEDKYAGYNQGDAFHLLFPSAYMHGWKVALAALDMKADEWNSLLTGIEALAALHGAGNVSDYGGAMAKGSPFHITKDAGFADAAVLEADQQSPALKYFRVTKESTTGYGVIDEKWRDIPGEMYVGGLLDMHAHANINGVVYTPGPLEWEPGNSGYAGNSDHFAYINGAIITGFGAFVKNKVAKGRYVLVYDNGAVDSLPIESEGMSITMRRFAWQELH